MADTDYGVDVLLVDGGLVIGAVDVPAMQPKMRRMEKVTTPVMQRVDE